MGSVTMKGAQQTSAVVHLPSPLLCHILDHLDVGDAIQLGKSCRKLLMFMMNLWSPKHVVLSYKTRQKIRRQIFALRENVALPSHFTHIFHSQSKHALLLSALGKSNRLISLTHTRSDKKMKLHHPYFYRQLPLAVSPDWILSEPMLNPEDIPLPHDLSLCDVMYILLLNPRSLERVDLQTFDTAPLPWNSTPSRVCPRDLLHYCLYDGLPSSRNSVCVWCPDCKPAQRDHNGCWQAAGSVVTQRLLTLSDPVTREELSRGLEGKIGPEFKNLKFLRYHGWGATNFLGILRVFGIARFPALETLEIGGTIIMSPGLTDTKDAGPRPRLSKDSCPMHVCPLTPLELQEKLAQIISFHISPYARYGFLISNHSQPSRTLPPHQTEIEPYSSTHRPCRRYDDTAMEQYWMGHFNGHLWQASGFPRLRKLALRVGNFDDSCRWITPMLENCFAYCPFLETLVLDHTILHPLREDNALLKLMSLGPIGTTPAFPSLRYLHLRMVESVFELARIQETVSSMLGRPIIIKTRKLFVRLASRWALQEAATIRQWGSSQKKMIESWLESEGPNITETDRDVWINLTKSTEDLSLWSNHDDGSSMLILSFDSHDPQADPPTGPLGTNWHEGEFASLESSPMFYGANISKTILKHFTPTNPTHELLLKGIRFAPADSPDTSLVRVASLATLDTSADEIEDPAYQKTSARQSQLKRVTVQLDLPQVWQVSEEEAKASVVFEVEKLKQLILEHPDLSRAQEARVMSCTRLTYGGSNWGWWEELICGKIRKRSKTMEVEGWARESADIIDSSQLRYYKCDHVWNAREDGGGGREVDPDEGNESPSV